MNSSMGEASLAANRAYASEFQRQPAFATWPSEALRRLDTIAVRKDVFPGAKLFLAGEPASGLFLVRQGRIKLSLPAAGEHKCLEERVLGPGAILGLEAAISGKTYEFTAEAMCASTVCFFPRVDFLTVLRQYPQATLCVTCLLSSAVDNAYAKLLSLRT